MSTYITVTSGTGALVNRVKLVQQANRETQLQRESDTALQSQLDTEVTAQVEQTQRPVGGNPDTSINRRPAAQRGTPSIVGIQYRFDFSNAPSGGVPGLAQQAQYTFTAFPTTNANTNITLPPAVYEPASGPNPGLATLGTVPPNADQETGLIVEYQSFNDEREYNLSIPLCLPLNNKATLFVMDYHYARHQLVFLRTNERASRRINPVTETSIYSHPTYSRENNYTSTYVFDNDDFQVVREIACFLVTPKGVRKLDTPSGFSDALYNRRPLASKNGTAQVLAVETYQTHEIMTNPTDLPQTVTTIPSTYTYQSVPVFQSSSWRPEYTGPGMGLAIQFGIGSLLDNTHGTASRDYFSGSVYQWLTKPMDLSREESMDYSYVRALISDFPGRYITSVAGFPSDPPPTYRPDRENFGIAKKAPLKYTGTPMSFDDFIWTSQYKFPANGAPASELAYVWNWDKEQYCRRRLLALGFKAADFVL